MQRFSWAKGQTKTFQMCGWMRHVLLHLSSWINSLLTALNDMLTITTKGIIKRSNEKVTLSVTLMGIQRNGSKVTQQCTDCRPLAARVHLNEKAPIILVSRCFDYRFPAHASALRSLAGLCGQCGKCITHIGPYWSSGTFILGSLSRATRRVQTNARAK